MVVGTMRTTVAVLIVWHAGYPLSATRRAKVQRRRVEVDGCRIRWS
jgi:hypothetical protein